MSRVLMAGEPFLDKDADTSGGNGEAASGSEDGQQSSDQDMFNRGYGKGIDKGKVEGARGVFDVLGVKSIDEAQDLRKAADSMSEQSRKAAEEQGKFKELYEQRTTEMEELRSKYDTQETELNQFREVQQSKLDMLMEKLTDEQKTLLDNSMPLAKRLQFAEQFAGATDGDGKKAVGGKAGTGTEPGAESKHTLEHYQRKGWANLSDEERADCKRLESQAYGGPAFPD